MANLRTTITITVAAPLSSKDLAKVDRLIQGIVTDGVVSKVERSERGTADGGWVTTLTAVLR